MVGSKLAWSYDERVIERHTKKDQVMKNHFLKFLVILGFLPSLACGVISAAIPTTVEGSGTIVTQKLDVSNFDRVSLNASGDVYIEQGDSESLTVEADDNILPLLNSWVRGSELVLSAKPNVSINPSQPIVYRLTVKDLSAFSLNGSGNCFVESIESDEMRLSISGSGNIAIKKLAGKTLSLDLRGSGNIDIDDLEVKTLDASIDGSGDITLKGAANSEKISINGSGNFRCGELESRLAEIQIPGSGNVIVWAQDQLLVDVNGSGDIQYYGNPSIEQHGFGSGNLIPLGEK